MNNREMKNMEKVAINNSKTKMVMSEVKKCVKKKILNVNLSKTKMVMSEIK